MRVLLIAAALLIPSITAPETAAMPTCPEGSSGYIQVGSQWTCIGNMKTTVQPSNIDCWSLKDSRGIHDSEARNRCLTRQYSPEMQAILKMSPQEIIQRDKAMLQRKEAAMDAAREKLMRGTGTQKQYRDAIESWARTKASVDY